MPCCFGMVASSKCLLCGAGLGHPPLSWVAPVAPGRDVLRLLLQYFFAEIFICLQAGSFRAVLRSGLCGSLRAVLVTRFGGGKVELLAILFVGAWVASMLLSERGHCMHTDLAGHLRRLLQWLVHCASMTACIGGGQILASGLHEVAVPSSSAAMGRSWSTAGPFPCGPSTCESVSPSIMPLPRAAKTLGSHLDLYPFASPEEGLPQNG